jgi:hypothetical protein
VDTKHRRHVVSGRETLARMDIAVGDVMADLGGDPIVEWHRVIAIELDILHGDNHSVTMLSGTSTAPREAPEFVDHELVVREARRRQRRRWVLIAVLLVASASVAAVIVGSSGGGGTSGRTSHAPARSHKVAPVATRGLSLSGGDLDPIDLTPDPAGDGVWFLGATAAGTASIYRWNGSKLTTYVLGNPAGDPQFTFGIQVGLAITSSEQPWVGINSTLLTVNTVTRATRTVSLPAPCTNPAIESPQLSAAQKVQDIQSLAINPDGVIAIVRSGANCVQIYDQGTNTFRTIALPPNHEPQQVAYDSSGELAVATTVLNSPQSGTSGVDNDVDLVSTSGKVASVSVGSVAVVSVASPATGFVTAGGQNEVDFLSDTGRITPFELFGSRSVNLEVGTPAYRLSDGSVVAATTSGFAVLNSSRSAGSLLSLGTFDCWGAGGARQSATSPTPPAKMRCDNHPTDFAVDSMGDIWFSEAGTGDSLREVEASSYVSK